MASVNNLSLRTTLTFLLISCAVFSQKQSDKLKREKESLEQSISNQKSLLSQNKANTKSTFQQLQLLETQLETRNAIIENVDNQIRVAELKIDQRSREIDRLSERQNRLKEKFKKLLKYAYKHRSKYGNWMYVFSSTDFFEAKRRIAYLKKLHHLQQSQFQLIKQNKKLIHTEISGIKTEKNENEELAVVKIAEKQEIEVDQKKRAIALKKLKSDEVKITALLKVDEKKRALLKQQIKKAIDKELAAELVAENKAAKKEAKTSKTTTKDVAAKDVAVKEVKKETTMVVKESSPQGVNFENNRGKIPWPVESGSITEGYGKHLHPTLPNVYTNNNGIDISAPKGASVRSVLEGEVTTIFEIPGAGKVIIIKHGNYRTVYSNLASVSVSKGSKVKTKQTIGVLIDDDGVSIVHFEVHKVVGGEAIKLNPSLWVAQ
jgi:septal ring factor EnvC (AmiA/AmiB activator)